MPMRYFDTVLMSHDQFIQYHNTFKDQLKEDRIKSIIVNVVGWGDEPQMCDAELCVSYKMPENYNELDQDQQYVIWDRNFEHEKNMIKKWEHYTNIAANYLISNHCTTLGADDGGRTMVIFNINEMEVQQYLYFHEIVDSRQPRKVVLA